MAVIRKLFALCLLLLGAFVMIGGGSCAVTVGIGAFGGSWTERGPLVLIALLVIGIGAVVLRAGRHLWRDTPPAP